MTQEKDLELTVNLGKDELKLTVKRKDAEEMKERHGMTSDQEVLIETENQVLRSVGRLDE